MTQIRLETINKKFGKSPAVCDVNLTLPSSQITVLIGKSGCGKTTTLRLIAGLEKSDSGSMWIGDQQVNGRHVWLSATQRKIGMVFQDYALFPHMTIAQNIQFGLTHIRGKARKKRVADMLDLVGLMGMEDRYPHQLSGGQQQRVALARALAPAPAVILLDEPFSNLDASLRQTMREEVRRILHETQVTTIFVTHDQEEGLRLADELVVMNEGHVLQHGRAEDVYRYPADMHVAQFLAKVNVLSGEAAGGAVESAIGRMPLHDPSIVGAVDIVLHPEVIKLTPDETGTAVIEDVRYFGFYQTVIVRLATGETVQVRKWSHHSMKIGDHVAINVQSPVVAFRKNS